MPLGVNISFKNAVEDYNKKIIKGNIINIKNLLIAVAGPFVNFSIAIILYSLRTINNEFINQLDLKNMIYINLLIGFFNLIPIFPLDGGRILKEILCIYLGKRKALDKTNKTSNISIIVLTVASSMLILVLRNIAIFLIIVYLWVLVLRENKRYGTLKNIYELIDKGNQ